MRAWCLRVPAVLAVPVALVARADAAPAVRVVPIMVRGVVPAALVPGSVPVRVVVLADSVLVRVVVPGSVPVPAVVRAVSDLVPEVVLADSGLVPAVLAPVVSITVRGAVRAVPVPGFAPPRPRRRAGAMVRGSIAVPVRRAS